MLLKRLGGFLGITSGVFLTALGLDIFLVPNKIAAGGISGIATILHFVIGTPVGAAMLALNVPLFILAIYHLGFQFAVRSLYGTFALSVFVDVMVRFLPVYTGDPLLAALFGGVIVGLGLGLVFRFNGTTGGTDMIAALLRRFIGFNIGQLLFAVDGAVVLAAGLAFRSAELAMYAFITIFVTAWIIDLVQEGFSYTRAFIIISDKSTEIARVITSDINRGATLLHSKGVYTGVDRYAILSVVGRTEVSKLKGIIYKIDPGAFVILADVHEVLGTGFKKPGGD
ncbi:MAG TPA: YitT family protein [Clostridia bacterium]|nr:YitT family protein [Clostridia bacterium]